jgi:hypothetical protein
MGQARDGTGGGRDLVEPEGVNAGSREMLRDEPGGEHGKRDVLSGGAPEKMTQPPPPSELLGPPTEEDTAYGSEAVGQDVGR